eukprot:134378_1
MSQKTKFLDLSDTFSDGKTGSGCKESPEWYLNSGVNYSGRCKNNACAQHGKLVTCRRGFGDIDPLKEKIRKKIQCPACNKHFAPEAVYLYDCKCEVEYLYWREEEDEDEDPQKKTHVARGYDLVTLGNKNGVPVHKYYSLLELHCTKH